MMERNLDETRCKKGVMQGYRSFQCKHKTWKDGWCKQHHPDTVKSRHEELDRRYYEKQKHEPWYLLKEARERIEALEGEKIIDCRKAYVAGAIAATPPSVWDSIGNVQVAFEAEAERLYPLPKTEEKA